MFRARLSMRRMTTGLVVVLGVVGAVFATTLVALAFFVATSTTEHNTFTAAAVDHITISPAGPTITAGESQSFTDTAFDHSNASFGDVTSSSSFSIAPDGSCTGASCTATVSGAHTVTAHFWGLTIGTALTVSPAAASKLVFTQSPSNSTGGVAFSTQP